MSDDLYLYRITLGHRLGSFFSTGHDPGEAYKKIEDYFSSEDWCLERDVRMRSIDTVGRILEYDIGKRDFFKDIEEEG